ncbi:hypothetical protein SALBM311S_12585 [Streptomyces alboniger]
MTREIAVVAFAQTDHRRTSHDLSEVEMLMPVLHDVLAQTGLRTADIGFTCSGSSDYLAGRAFSFTLALDGVGAWPPISESHVEMDGAWALYEAWTKLLTGDADTALVYSYGKSSPGSVRDVLTRQLDPYYVAPLWPDSVALAALQAQALIDAGDTDEPELAAVAARSREHASANSHAQLRRGAAGGSSYVPCAPATARPSPTRRRRDPRGRGAREPAHGPPGSGHRPPHRGAQPGGAGPDRLALHPPGRREGRRLRQARRHGRAARPFTAQVFRPAPSAALDPLPVQPARWHARRPSRSAARHPAVIGRPTARTASLRARPRSLHADLRPVAHTGPGRRTRSSDPR